jgi:hypothetical protein
MQWFGFKALRAGLIRRQYAGNVQLLHYAGSQLVLRPRAVGHSLYVQ